MWSHGGDLVVGDRVGLTHNRLRCQRQEGIPSFPTAVRYPMIKYCSIQVAMFMNVSQESSLASLRSPLRGRAIEKADQSEIERHKRHMRSTQPDREILAIQLNEDGLINVCA